MPVAREQWLTVDEAAEALRVSRATIYRFIASGAISTAKFGRARRVAQSELDRFATARVEASHDAA